MVTCPKCGAALQDGRYLINSDYVEARSTATIAFLILNEALVEEKGEGSISLDQWQELVSLCEEMKFQCKDLGFPRLLYITEQELIRVLQNVSAPSAALARHAVVDAAPVIPALEKIAEDVRDVIWVDGSFTESPMNLSSSTRWFRVSFRTTEMNFSGLWSLITVRTKRRVTFSLGAPKTESTLPSSTIRPCSITATLLQIIWITCIWWVMSRMVTPISRFTC